ncbi:hypothetical protein [Streptomyces fungicidicus]|uniref:hypothetical protein n=1 Tax=Streptomyces fungicidicus TaxID=68203 RepID=UPI0033DEB899
MTPTRTCATTASSGPSPPNAKPRRPAEHQEHDQAVPEQKAGGTWLSRFRG